MSEVNWSLLVSTAILAVLAVILVVKWIGRDHRLPPGPWLIPFIGGLRLMASGDLTRVFRSLQKKYGDVFCIRAGCRLLVFLNGYDTIKEALIKRADDFSDRSDSFINTSFVKGRGIGGTSGYHWKQTRTLTINALRELRLGQRSLESRIQEEVDIFTDKIINKNEKPFDISAMTQKSVSNIICSITFGKRFDYNDKEFEWLLSRLNFPSLSPTKVLTTFPALRFLPGDLFGIKSTLKGMHESINYFSMTAAKHRESFDKKELRDIIDFFIQKQTENRKGNRVLQDDNLDFIIFNLFAAGTETTSTTIRWTILYFLRNPKVQERMFMEIKAVVGLSRTPTIADRPNMPYCEAVIAEVLRISNIVPLALPHGAIKDINFKGYVIPKGASILLNLDSVLHDPKLFPNPEQFNPERFLDKDGKFNGAKKVIAFSLGRRICLGEALARMQLFLFLTCIVQKFEMVPEDYKNPPTEDGLFGLTYEPKPFQLRALIRK